MGLPNVSGDDMPDLCFLLLELAAERGSAHAAGSLARLLQQKGQGQEKVADLFQRFARMSMEDDENQNAGATGNCEDTGLESWVGITRPTAYDDSFGWDNHGLLPHTALGAAADIFANGLQGVA